MITRSFAPYAAVAIAASAWGTWPLILRHADAIKPMHAALVAVIVMAMITVVSGIAMTRDRLPARATTRDWLGIAWLGIGDAANCFLFFKAYQVTSVAIAVLTHYLTPILVAIAAPLLLKERLSARGYGAVALSFLGLVFLLGPWRAQSGAHDLDGALLGAGSAVFYASNIIVNKRLVGIFSASELMFFHGLVATPLLALLVPHAVWSSIDCRAAAIVTAGAVGPGALAGLFFVWGLQRIPANHASTLTLLEPLVAVVASVVVLKESASALSVVGGACILGGAALVVLQVAAAPSDCRLTSPPRTERRDSPEPP